MCTGIICKLCHDRNPRHKIVEIEPQETLTNRQYSRRYLYCVSFV